MAVRHDFYQTDSAVIVSLYKKKANPQEVAVHFTISSLRFTVAEEELLRIDPLFGQIDPSKSWYKTLSTKIEVTLAKSSAVTWSSLSSNLATSGQSTPSPITRPPPKSDLAAEPRHEAETATPEGSVTAGKKEKKDWSKIAATEEAEEEAGGADDFFKKLFKDADDDTRRAMMKSFSESGGTTLSTNWQDVGSRTVTGEPPAGVERKKW